MKNKSCIVLDIDATIVDMFGSCNNWHLIKSEYRKEILDRVVTIDIGDTFYWGSKRPHLNEFLTSCFETFDIVGIWSAGKREYVHEIAQELFISKGFCPNFIWSKEYCVPQYIFKHDLIVKQKPLAKLYHVFPEIDPKKTIIIDDRSDVTSQDMLNHVWIPIWGNGYETFGKQDDVLLRISKQFSKLKGKENYKHVSFNLEE